MCIAVAIIGAGVIGAVGTAVAGSEAAGATREASNAAVGVQEQALAQQKGLAAPYTGLGESAIPTYEALLGIAGPGGAPANPDTVKNALAATPGYQFAKSQGDLGIANAASTQGGISGNTLAALDTFNTGLADQTYQAEVGDIGGAVGIGQAAAAGQAANIGTAAGNVSNILTNQGNTIAGIDIGVAQGLTRAGSGVASGLLESQLISALNS